MTVQHLEQLPLLPGPHLRSLPAHCLAAAVTTWRVPQVVEASGLAPVGEVLLVPDLAAAVPGVCGQGGLMAPVDMMEKDLSEWLGC